MAVVAEELVADLVVRSGKLKSELNSTASFYDAKLNKMSGGAKSLERDFAKSTSGISASIKGIASSLAVGFSVEKIQELADGYTKFTNQLKVAGLEGSNLASVQGDLFAVAQKYGVQLESLGGLYGRLSQGAKELGASQAGLLKFTGGVAAALKIQGGAASESQGAILQLTQALGGAVVRAEEFNSINEGARPILQAVANNITRFGGSVSKLRNEVLLGKVTSQEFYQAFIRGSDELEQKATKANLTIGASFVVLNNALGQYIGQTDASYSATQRISGALVALSDNLDKVIPALAVIAEVIGVRYLAGVGAAAAGTIALTAAEVRATQMAAAHAAAMSAAAVAAAETGVATNVAAVGVTRLGVAMGVAGRGGAALAGMLGGPVGIAVLALTASLYYLSVQTANSNKASADYATALDKATEANKKADSAIEELANSHGVARTQAIALMQAEIKLTEAKLNGARASLALAEAEAARTKAAAQNNANSVLGRIASAVGTPFTHDPAAVATERAANKAEANRKAAEATVIAAQARLAKMSVAITTPEKAATAAVGKAVKARSVSEKSHADTAKETAAKARRAESDLNRLDEEIIRAKLDTATSADDRADLQRELLAAEYKSRTDEIDSNTNLSDAQKKIALGKLEKLYGRSPGSSDDITVAGGALLPKAINKEQQRANEEMADRQLADDRDTLKSSADLLLSRVARAATEQRILDLTDEEEQRALDRAIADGQVTDAVKARANLASRQADRRTGSERDNASPLEKYKNDIKTAGSNINDAVESVAVSGLENLNSGLTDAIYNFSSLGDVAKSVMQTILKGIIDIVIQQALIKPLAGLIGGATGGIGSLIGGIFGRASGGNVNAGQMYRVNEGASGTRKEYFQPAVGGKIIPLGQTASARGGGAAVRNFNITVDARNSVTPAGFADSISRQVLSQAAHMDAQAARGTLAAMPNRLSQYSNDGI